MSVLNPVIESIDGPSRRIFLLDGVTTFHPIDDIYKEVRYLRRTNETLRRFDMFVEAGGNVQRIGNSFTPRYLRLLKGTKIVAGDGVDRITVTGDIFTDDALDTDIFDDSLLAPGRKIAYYLSAPEAEVIVVNGSGGGGSGSGVVTSIAPNAITAASLSEGAVNEIAAAVEAQLADEFGNIAASVDLTPVLTAIAAKPDPDNTSIAAILAKVNTIVVTGGKVEAMIGSTPVELSPELTDAIRALLALSGYRIGTPATNTATGIQAGTYQVQFNTTDPNTTIVTRIS